MPMTRHADGEGRHFRFSWRRQTTGERIIGFAAVVLALGLAAAGKWGLTPWEWVALLVATAVLAVVGLFWPQDEPVPIPGPEPPPKPPARPHVQVSDVENSLPPTERPPPGQPRQVPGTEAGPGTAP